MALKVLIIGYVWPEPRSTGAGVRMMQLIRSFLEQQWEVIFATPAAETDHMADLTALGVLCRSIDVNSSSFDRFATETAPDIVLFDRFIMEEQFGWRIEKCCPDALRLLETVDLHSLRDARQQALKQDRAMDSGDLFSDTARREIAAIYRCDLSLVISDYEEQLLQETFSLPKSLIHCCPFMFDSADMVRPAPAFEQRRHFVTIGNFRHAPNWDSVLWLKEAIWPMIRSELPEAELHVYGSYPPKKATLLHDPRNGFLIRGWAEDVLEVMQQARVCLAPLRFGAGIKGKLADAMLAGTPSITTSIGAEGMRRGHDWCGFVEDEEKAIARAAISLYSDQETWKSAHGQCFTIASQLFDKQENSSQLISRILHLRENLRRQRLLNFTGSMLRYHHHRSTEFMSRWIEAKNGK